MSNMLVCLQQWCRRWCRPVAASHPRPTWLTLASWAISSFPYEWAATVCPVWGGEGAGWSVDRNKVVVALTGLHTLLLKQRRLWTCSGHRRGDQRKQCTEDFVHGWRKSQCLDRLEVTMWNELPCLLSWPDCYSSIPAPVVYVDMWHRIYSPIIEGFRTRVV